MSPIFLRKNLKFEVHFHSREFNTMHKFPRCYLEPALDINNVIKTDYLGLN